MTATDANDTNAKALQRDLASLGLLAYVEVNPPLERCERPPRTSPEESPRKKALHMKSDEHITF